MVENEEFYILAAKALEDPFDAKTFDLLHRIVAMKDGHASLETLVKALEERAASLRVQPVGMWLKTGSSAPSFRRLIQHYAGNREQAEPALHALSDAYAAFAADLMDAGQVPAARDMLELRRGERIQLFADHRINLHQHGDPDVNTSEQRLALYYKAGFGGDGGQQQQRPTAEFIGRARPRWLEEWMTECQRVKRCLWPDEEKVTAWMQGVMPMTTTRSMAAPTTTTTASPIPEGTSTPCSRAEMVARWALHVAGGPGSSTTIARQYRDHLEQTHGLQPAELTAMEAAVRDELASMAKAASSPTLWDRAKEKIADALVEKKPLVVAAAVAHGRQQQQRQFIWFSDWYREARRNKTPPAESISLGVSVVAWCPLGQGRIAPAFWLPYYTPREWYKLGVTDAILNKWGVRLTTFRTPAMNTWCPPDVREQLWPGIID
jgi:hypothetical protein